MCRTIAFIGFVIGLPMIQDMQIQRSITIVESARYVLDDTNQYSGNYQQKNLYYWSPQSISEISQFYQNFTTAPFIEFNSNGERWLIAAWKGSKLIENPIRKIVVTHTDLCDYRKVFECISIVLFDASQASLPDILQRVYGNSTNKTQFLFNSGTLIVFSYNIPGPG